MQLPRRRSLSFPCPANSGARGVRGRTRRGSRGKATVLLNEKEHFLPLNHAAGSPGCPDRKGPHNFTQLATLSPAPLFTSKPAALPFPFSQRRRNRRAHEILTSVAIPDVEQRERKRKGRRKKEMEVEKGGGERMAGTRWNQQFSSSPNCKLKRG